VNSIKSILLKEDPENIEVDGVHYDFLSSEAKYTVVIFNDHENKLNWAAWDYDANKLISSVENILEKIRERSGDEWTDIDINYDNLPQEPYHHRIVGVLRELGYGALGATGNIRVYKIDGKWYFSFWSNEEIKTLKNCLLNFIDTVHMIRDNVFIEFGLDWKPLAEVFTLKSTQEDELTKRKKQMALDLHVKKGMLDKAIINVLQTKPKNRDELYARLERELNMPLVKIKSVFSNIPLDKLVSKKITEIKSSLNESPDGITFGDDYMSFNDGLYTFLVYHDTVDKQVQWAAYDYVSYEILSSSESLKKDFSNLKEKPSVKDALNSLKFFSSHQKLRNLLSELNHFDDSYDNILDGRMYEYDGEYYFPIWQKITELRKYRDFIDQFLKDANINPAKVKFESDDESEFYPYSEIFKSTVKKTLISKVKNTDGNNDVKKLKYDLHVKKGMLDKAIVQVLQSRPKDADTLYRRLETQFGTPIAKIKHLYGAVPLDKLISKKAKELIRESILPADRWVGVIDYNGSVILPPNQDGDRQHYHYGLEGYQYRFSYWPHKKEVSWWNFPTEEEDLAVKVEEYLIRKGHQVNRHVDYTGKKIRDVLNESMFPKDFDRHSLGSCMAAAAMATDYLLSKGRSDFKVMEGWVSLYPDQEEEDFSPHTWIQFNNGKIFDPTKKQWAKWGFDPYEVEFKSISKSYSPQEYQSVCQRQPDDLTKFKKQGIDESVSPENEELSSLATSDQLERVSYKKFVEDRFKGDYTMGSREYAKIKKRNLSDIFGDEPRLKKFIGLNLNFDSFSEKDWENYFILAQHCDFNHTHQKLCLKVIERYLGKNNDHYKYLCDRINCNQTGNQIYGTQKVCKKRKMTESVTYRELMESSTDGMYLPDFLYHATYRPLMTSIEEKGIVPGGVDYKNFDWSKDFVYLAANSENAISFIECSENEDIPEDWLDDIVVVSIDVSKLDRSKLFRDENWNPSMSDNEPDGWQSYQYSGTIPPDAINL
jgi:hypothetical protein